jgi:phosphate-selective porin
METFYIPVIWSVTDVLKVQANTIEEACLEAYKNDELGRGHYLDDSLKINTDLIEYSNSGLKLTQEQYKEIQKTYDL